MTRYSSRNDVIPSTETAHRRPWRRWGLASAALTLTGVALATGPAGAATINGTNGPDTLQGTAGADELVGGAGKDKLSGAAGDDHLWGNDGNDTLVGGAGRDVLTGDAGADTYTFSGKFGQDVVSDGTASQGDRLVFTDLRSNQVTTRQTDGKLVITTPNGTVTINGQSGANGIETFDFTDTKGLTWQGSKLAPPPPPGAGKGSGSNGVGGGELKSPGKSGASDDYVQGLRDGLENKNIRTNGSTDYYNGVRDAIKSNMGPSQNI